MGFQTLFETKLAEAPSVGYIPYTNGDFDGQGSGHDYYGTLYMPPTGFVNNCDGAARTPTATTARSKRSGRNPTKARRGQLRPHDHSILARVVSSSACTVEACTRCRTDYCPLRPGRRKC